MAFEGVFVATGCASGIGRALADALARNGARLLATDRDLEALERGAAEAGWPVERVATRRLDVTSEPDWREALDDAERRFGPVTVLYNVAGYLRPGWAHAFPLEEVARHLDVNARGVILGTRLAAERMVAAGRGHIVNIASMAALAPIPGLALYSASKYAVRAFSLAAAVELARHGLAVTVVCPDAVATPMLDLQKQYREAAMTFTAPRVLTAEEVVAVLIGPVLAKRPLEVAIPPGRKWLARLADVVPELARRLAPLMAKQGLARQKHVR
jgi:3-oxoacyl-[acyl-carrier protein] reductase